MNFYNIGNRTPQENYMRTFQHNEDNPYHSAHIEEFQQMTKIAIEQAKQDIYRQVYDIFCKAIKDMGVDLDTINIEGFRNQIEREVKKALSGFSLEVNIR